MGHESGIAVEFVSVLAEDGTVTLPPEILEEWALKAGDQLEFFQDHADGWQLRPRNLGPLEFLKHLPRRAKRPDVMSDEDALSKALVERNLRPSAIKAAG